MTSSFTRLRQARAVPSSSSHISMQKQNWTILNKIRNLQTALSKEVPQMSLLFIHLWKEKTKAQTGKFAINVKSKTYNLQSNFSPRLRRTTIFMEQKRLVRLLALDSWEWILCLPLLVHRRPVSILSRWLDRRQRSTVLRLYARSQNGTAVAFRQISIQSSSPNSSIRRLALSEWNLQVNIGWVWSRITFNYVPILRQRLRFVCSRPTYSGYYSSV